MSTGSDLRIAYCTWGDPSDRTALSGVLYHALEALRLEFDAVTSLGPLASPRMRLGRLYNRVSLRLLRRRYDYLHATHVSKEIARGIERKLRRIACDAIVAPMASEAIAYLRTAIPVVYVADATFSLLEDGYPAFSNLLDRSRRQGHETERRAIALEALRVLVRSGVEARLTVIGCRPPPSFSLPPAGRPVEVLPYLDKNRPADRRLYSRRFEEATVLLAPARRDCSPMVLAEAAAHGLPVLAAAVGGIPSLVREGESGHLLPPGAGGGAYAAAIADLVEGGGRYERLARGARRLYETELNWETWGRRMREIVEEVALPRRGSPRRGWPPSPGRSRSRTGSPAPRGCGP